MMRHHARSVVIVLGMSVAAALLSACTAIPDRPQTAVSVDKVWPPEPARARIGYAGAFSTPKDLGINKGLLTRITEFITGGSDWHLVRPMAVLPTADGRIFVADPGTRAVHCFDTTRGKHYLILGPDGQAFPSPTGLAIDRHGALYITDSALAGVFVVQPGAETANALEMHTAPEQPTNIAIDQDGNLYVIDALRHHIKVYDRTGRFIRKIGQRGNADGEFNFPSMIWFDQNNHLLVSDALNFRIQILDRQGRFIGKFGRHGDGSGDMSRPKGVASDSHGHIYVVDALFHTVQVFNNSGDFLLNFGERGNAAGQFLLPTGIHVTRDNMIYVADSQNSRIQMFRYIGDQP